MRDAGERSGVRARADQGGGVGGPWTVWRTIGGLPNTWMTGVGSSSVSLFGLTSFGVETRAGLMTCGTAAAPTFTVTVMVGAT